MEKQQQIDYSSELQQLRNSLDSLHIDIDKQSKVTADKLSNLKLENKTVYLSMPDSTGKQYPIISQISSKLDSLYQRVNELSKSSGKTIELSWWDLHKDKIYLSAIITMLITIFLVKIKKSYHL